MIHPQYPGVSILSSNPALQDQKEQKFEGNIAVDHRLAEALIHRMMWCAKDGTVDDTPQNTFNQQHRRWVSKIVQKEYF